MRKLLVILILTSLSFAGFAQDTLHAYIKHFSAQTSNGKLFLSWTTHAGFSCEDIEIELSEDSINFETKGIYYGTCGDYEERDYTYIVDEPYLNKTNYVRLNLGSFGNSFVINQFVLKLDNAVQIVPHPANSQSIFYFDNTSNQEVQIDIYSLQGEQVTSITTIDSQLKLVDFKLSKGLYVYAITYPKGSAIRGKFFFEEL
jgi:hypothetical protein